MTSTLLTPTLADMPHDLPAIPDWMHAECDRRAQRQVDLMVPFMGFNSVTRSFDAVDAEESRSLAYKAAVEEVKALYREPMTSPDGLTHAMTNDLVAWIEEYGLQWSYFGGAVARQAAIAQTASYFDDGKRFTMARFMTMKTDLLGKAKAEKGVGLN